MLTSVITGLTMWAVVRAKNWGSAGAPPPEDADVADPL